MSVIVGTSCGRRRPNALAYRGRWVLSESLLCLVKVMPSKSGKTFLSPQLIFILAILAGTLGWEVLVSILALGGLELELSTGPVGFDVEVLSFYLEVNPGTFIGLFAGYRLAGSVTRGSRPSGSRSSRASSKKTGKTGDGGSRG